MPNPNDYDTDTHPDEHRPNLSPVDPRATASGNPEFHIAGSIDNESCFNLATGQSERSQH